jgi:ribosome-associated protein
VAPEFKRNLKEPMVHHKTRGPVLEAAAAAAGKKAEDIVILDVSEVLTITDFFLICHGNSDRQVRTIAEEVQRRLRTKRLTPYRREGEREARWVLLDFVDFVVHVFQRPEREYYDLERLWADAPIVAFDQREVEAGDEPISAEAT